MNDRRDQTFHATAAQAGKTLAAALRTWLPEDSWSKLRKLVEERRITVNGNLCRDSGRVLKAGDVVKRLANALPPPPDERHLRLVYRDAHVVVVEKPAGITSTRHHEEERLSQRRKQLQPTLDEMLPRVLAQLESASGRGKEGKPARPGQRPNQGGGKVYGGQPRPPRVFPVHRLDRETSGLMAFARTPAAEAHLMGQFRQHTTHRRYLALACGHVTAQTIASNLVRDRGDGRRGSTAAANVGKRAVTHVQPLEYVGDYTLLECRLETGRTHQIRIHLAELGHPLCGERVYRAPAAARAPADRSGAPRVALHAAELGFTHPVSGRDLKFQSPLPRDLHDLLHKLRKQAKTETE